MSTLTIFSAPKPFLDAHIATIQRNAIRSWVQLGPEVEVVLVGEEAGLAEAAAELGVRHLPAVKRNTSGTPLVSSIFELARQAGNSPFLAYVNADVLLGPDLLAGVQQVGRQLPRFLIVGQRWDVDVRQPLDFSAGWAGRLEELRRQTGRLHPRGGSDYFIFPRDCFVHVPAFAIGRAGWDNWMIYEGRRQRWPVVDATGAIHVLHQDHDYRHLPGGQPHYRLPETYENVRLAGGSRTIFTLADCDRQLAVGQVRPFPRSWAKFWREVEIFPLVRLRSYRLAQASYAVFHPRRAYGDFRAWLRRRGNS